MSIGTDPFARIAQTAKLSKGQLALILVSGPRFRAEEGLALIRRQLPAERPTLWHRLDYGGPDIARVVARNESPEPIVLVHGLEYVSFRDLPQLESELNLLRDNLAALDATIIIWIPSDGLADFQRHCADLFHWRSLLVTLSDADVPVSHAVVTTRQYLVESPYDPGHRGAHIPFPSKGTGVVGREADLRRLRETLAKAKAQPNGRFVSVFGLAGRGKTQLLVDARTTR